MFFISYETQDPLARQWASWVYEQLGQNGVAVQVAHHAWALGYWHQYLQTIVERAQGVIVLLSGSYLTSTEAFVEGQRRLVLQKPASRLLVVLIGECQLPMPEASVFYQAPWIDLRPATSGTAQASASLIQAVMALP